MAIRTQRRNGEHRLLPASKRPVKEALRISDSRRAVDDREGSREKPAPKHLIQLRQAGRHPAELRRQLLKTLRKFPRNPAPA